AAVGLPVVAVGPLRVLVLRDLLARVPAGGSTAGPARFLQARAPLRGLSPDAKPPRPAASEEDRDRAMNAAPRPCTPRRVPAHPAASGRTATRPGELRHVRRRARDQGIDAAPPPGPAGVRG